MKIELTEAEVELLREALDGHIDRMPTGYDYVARRYPEGKYSEEVRVAKVNELREELNRAEELRNRLIS